LTILESKLDKPRADRQTQLTIQRGDGSSGTGAIRHDRHPQVPIESGGGVGHACAEGVRDPAPTTSSSSLDHIGQNATTPNTRTEYEKKVKRKRYRIFHRMTSGHQRHGGERLRHMTLTSIPGTDPATMSKHKQRLIQEIRRLTPFKLYKLGYMDYAQLHSKYSGHPYGKPLTFEYLSLKTNEGNGVYHIPFYGDYIPHKWLSDKWVHIHGAHNVWLTDYGCVKNTGKMTGYLLNQYIAGQERILETRLSWSRGWVFRRFVRVWNYILTQAPDRDTRDRWWQEICETGRLPPEYSQQSELAE
jgi:hypothetical protein